MEINNDIVSMSATDPHTNKDITIAYSTKLQAEIAENILKNNELQKKGNRIKKIQIIVLICIGIIMLLILFSGKISMIGNNIFCR